MAFGRNKEPKEPSGFKKYDNCQLRDNQYTLIMQRRTVLSDENQTTYVEEYPKGEEPPLPPDADKEKTMRFPYATLAKLVCERTRAPLTNDVATQLSVKVREGPTEANNQLRAHVGELLCPTCVFCNMSPLEATEYRLAVQRNLNEIELNQAAQQKALEQLNEDRPANQPPYS